MATATKTKRKVKAPTVNVVISTFAGADEMKFNTPRSCSIGKYTPITDEDYILEYGTPLRDATGRFINNLEKLKQPGSVVIGCLADMSLSMSGNEKAVINGLNEFIYGMKDIKVDSDADGRVLAVIFTDGEELHSSEIGSNDLRNMIANKEDEGWTFIYLGANQDAWLNGSSMGMRVNTNFAATPRGTSSALRYAGFTASSYLSSNAATLDSLASGTISEDGDYSDQNISPLGVSDNLSKSSYDVKSAINKAKGS